MWPFWSYSDLVKIGPVVSEKKLTDDARGMTDDDGPHSTAIRQLCDSGDIISEILNVKSI